MKRVDDGTGDFVAEASRLTAAVPPGHFLGQGALGTLQQLDELSANRFITPEDCEGLFESAWI